MSRDWDKLRRQSKVGKYDPVESFKLRKRFRGRQSRKIPPYRDTVGALRPAMKLVLRIETPTMVAGVLFQRTQGRWRCVKAAPVFEWMERVRHPEVIQEWLRKNGFSYQWVKPTTGLGASKDSPEEHPAEAHTLKEASHSPEVNSVPSLNNDTNADHPGPMPVYPALLEQNGLKPTPRCLIGSECSEQPQAEPIAT